MQLENFTKSGVYKRILLPRNAVHAMVEIALLFHSPDDTAVRCKPVPGKMNFDNKTFLK